MSTEVEVLTEGTTDIDLKALDTAEKRFQGLSKTFTSAIIIIAEMQKNRDWETLQKEDGASYKNLTDLVQDALKISDSYARRLVQTVDGFYTPLEAVTVEGTVISITSVEAAKLGNDGMKEVVDGVSNQVSDTDGPEEQSELIEAVTKDVLDKRDNVDVDDFDDFDDDIDFDDDFDDIANDSDSAPAPAPSSSEKSSGGSSEAGSNNSSSETKSRSNEPVEKQKPSDYLGPIQAIMSGGKEYKTPEAVAELEEPLKSFVETVNYLAELDHEEITEMIDKDHRGATYSIRKAASNLTLIVSSVETSSWVLEQI